MSNWKQPQPALVSLKGLLNRNFPEIQRLEVMSDRYVAGTTVKSAHAEGRAMDIFLDAKNPRERLLADQLVWAFVQSAEADGISNVIYNRRIWSRSKPRFRIYEGKHPHEDHIHIEFDRDSSQKKILGTIDLHIRMLRGGLGEMEDLAKAYKNIG